MTVRKCSLCLIRKKEIDPFVQELQKKYPSLQIEIHESLAAIDFTFKAEINLDPVLEEVRCKFPTFFYGEGSIQEAVAREFIARKKTLALAESCTGGMLASILTLIPDASKYLLGSIVAYSNAFKERFLHVNRSTIDQKGAVSKETVVEMVKGLLQETDADYAVALSGVAGPSGGSKEKPVGTIYIAIGHRSDRIDVGVIHAAQERAKAMEMASLICLGALWRRIVHNVETF